VLLLYIQDSCSSCLNRGLFFNCGYEGNGRPGCLLPEGFPTLFTLTISRHPSLERSLSSLPHAFFFFAAVPVIIRQDMSICPCLFQLRFPPCQFFRGPRPFLLPLVRWPATRRLFTLPVCPHDRSVVELDEGSHL